MIDLPEIYNPVQNNEYNQTRSVDNSSNYGVNMWSPLNQWFDENKESYANKLQSIGGLIGEGSGVLGAYLGGMENPISLLNIMKNTDTETDDSNQPVDNTLNNQTNNQTNADPNMSISNQTSKPSYSTQGWYGGHAAGQTDPLTNISSQYNSGPGLFSWQNAKNILELGTGGFGFGAQDYEDVDYDALMLQQGGTAGGYGS